MTRKSREMKFGYKSKALPCIGSEHRMLAHLICAFIVHIYYSKKRFVPNSKFIYKRFIPDPVHLSKLSAKAGSFTDF